MNQRTYRPRYYSLEIVERNLWRKNLFCRRLMARSANGEVSEVSARRNVKGVLLPVTKVTNGHWKRTISSFVFVGLSEVKGENEGEEKNDSARQFRGVTSDVGPGI
jgi:hypothetical protein